MPTPSPAVIHYPEQNHLLAVLGDKEHFRLNPYLQLVPMPLGKIIRDAGENGEHFYFPTTATVAIVYGMNNGNLAQIAIIGNEGGVKISQFMGGETGPFQAAVVSAGHGYRIKTRRLKDELNRAGPMLHLMLRYTQAFVSQVAQTGACNRHHSIDQQLSRWPRISLDRLPSNEIVVTHELLSHMVGVRRERVTAAAARLQGAGLIHCGRGKVTVLNRPALEETVCECYAVVKREYERLLQAKAGHTPKAALLSQVEQLPLMLDQQKLAA